MPEDMDEFLIRSFVIHSEFQMLFLNLRRIQYFRECDWERLKAIAFRIQHFSIINVIVV